MPTITFDDIPNQFDPVIGFLPPLPPFPPVPILVGYRGFEYVEDGFLIVARPGQPFPRAEMNYSIAQSSNYFISGDDIPFDNSTALNLFNSAGNSFGIKSIKLDGFLHAPTVVTFVATDAFGSEHRQVFSTDGQAGMETFSFGGDFQSNLINLSWSGDLIGVPDGHHLPFADDIEMINVSPSTKLTHTPPASNITTFAVFAFSSDDPDASFEYRLDGGNWVSTSIEQVQTDHFVKLTVSTGQHKFEVRAVHDALVDPTPAAFSWTAHDDVKIDITNGIATVKDPTDQYEEIVILIDGVIKALSEDQASHEWTATISGLSQGPHTFAVQTTDKNGVVSSLIDLNLPPTINGGDTAKLSIAENTMAVTTVMASDPEGKTLSYSILGGGDGGKFNIDENGVLAFKTAPDFETPTDARLNNVYDVTVQVSDGQGVDTQAIAVTVTNVNEAPTLALAHATTSLAENTDTSSPVKVADIIITDDGTGTNNLALSGADGALFTIVGTGLFLKAGTVLDL